MHSSCRQSTAGHSRPERSTAVDFSSSRPALEIPATQNTEFSAFAVGVIVATGSCSLSDLRMLTACRKSAHERITQLTAGPSL
jgi:hypothetical protein